MEKQNMVVVGGYSPIYTSWPSLAMNGEIASREGEGPRGLPVPSGGAWRKVNNNSMMGQNKPKEQEEWLVSSSMVLVWAG